MRRGLILGVFFLLMISSVRADFPYNVQNYTEGVISNFPVHQFLNVPEPAKEACVFDNRYNTSVCKTENANSAYLANSGNTVRPVYSRWRADNSNGQYYFLVKAGETPPSSGRGQMVIYYSNDSLYKIANILGQESAEFRWDYTGNKPSTLYYRSGCNFREYNITTETTSLIHNFSVEFPNCGRILNDVEGDSSADSRYWAFMVQGAYSGGNYPMIAIVTYDKQTDSILGILNYTDYLSLGGTATTLPRPNMVDMSPSGDKIVLLTGRCWGTNTSGTRPGDIGSYFDGPHAWNKDFTNPVKVCIDETHSGWAFDSQGGDVYVCQDNRNDYITYTNIYTGEQHRIVFHGDLGWGNGFHFSRFYNSTIRGWVYMTTYSTSNATWGANQALMLEIKDISQHPRVWRIASTYNNYSSAYEREAFSPISADGQTIYWGGYWPNGDGTVDTYKVTLPPNWWIEINSIANQSQNQTIYHAADTNQNSYLEMTEIMNYVRQFKLGTVTRTNVLDGVMNFFKGRYN